eukprot:1609469-Prymnesium_polylepis.1
MAISAIPAFVAISAVPAFSRRGTFAHRRIAVQFAGREQCAQRLLDPRARLRQLCQARGLIGSLKVGRALRLSVRCWRDREPRLRRGHRCRQGILAEPRLVLRTLRLLTLATFATLAL